MKNKDKVYSSIEDKLISVLDIENIMESWENFRKKLEKKKLEKVKKYQREGRGDWWFYPLWKKILYVVLFPFIMTWLVVCWLLMKFGRGIYMLGDFLTGWRLNQGDWSEDV